MARLVRSGQRRRGSQRRSADREPAARQSPLHRRRARTREKESRHEQLRTLDLVPVWTIILGVGILFYVLLDGFDLGVGILFGFAPGYADRATPIMNVDRADLGWQRDLAGPRQRRSVRAPFRSPSPSSSQPSISPSRSCCSRWSSAGWPSKFRFRDAAHKTSGTMASAMARVVATFAQGIVLGAFIQGFEVDGRVFSRLGSFDCFTPFSLVTGIALHLRLRCSARAGWCSRPEGEPCRRRAPPWACACAGVLVAVGVVSIWTPIVEPAIAARWFALSEHRLFRTGAAAGRRLSPYFTWRASRRQGEGFPRFAAAAGLFLMSYHRHCHQPLPDDRAASLPRSGRPRSRRARQAFLLIDTLFAAADHLVYTGLVLPGCSAARCAADIGYH